MCEVCGPLTIQQANTVLVLALCTMARFNSRRGVVPSLATPELAPIQGSLCSGHLLTTHFSQAFRCALETEIPSSPRDSLESAQLRTLQLHQVADAGVTGESSGGKSIL
jgi:hypothetical protein